MWTVLIVTALSSCVFADRVIPQEYKDPSVRISTGIYLKPAPPESIIYSQTTPIVFSVQLGYQKIQTFHSEALDDFCDANLDAEFHPLCLIRSTLRLNLDNAAKRLSKIYLAMTGLNEYPRFPDVRFKMH